MRAFCAILLVALAIVVHANEQTVGVKGTLWCGKEPIPHSDVQLLVHDTCSFHTKVRNTGPRLFTFHTLSPL